MGAGLGPATAFLYSGPAINVLAIVLTARVLGLELGVARAVGAVVFSVVIGLLMHLIFRKEEKAKAEAQMAMPEAEVTRPLWQNVLFFFSLVAILVFANWGKPSRSRRLFRRGIFGEVADHRPCRPGLGRDPGPLVPLAVLEGGRRRRPGHRSGVRFSLASRCSPSPPA